LPVGAGNISLDTIKTVYVPFFTSLKCYIILINIVTTTVLERIFSISFNVIIALTFHRIQYGTDFNRTVDSGWIMKIYAEKK
jgi:hypothetical protein